MKNSSDATELFNKIAKSMGNKIATWEDVNECIEKDISFTILIDAKRYMTNAEIKQIEQKSFMGGNHKL